MTDRAFTLSYPPLPKAKILPSNVMQQEHSAVWQSNEEPFPPALYGIGPTRFSKYDEAPYYDHNVLCPCGCGMVVEAIYDKLVMRISRSGSFNHVTYFYAEPGRDTDYHALAALMDLFQTYSHDFRPTHYAWWMSFFKKRLEFHSACTKLDYAKADLENGVSAMNLALSRQAHLNRSLQAALAKLNARPPVDRNLVNVKEVKRPYVYKTPSEDMRRIVPRLRRSIERHDAKVDFAKYRVERLRHEVDCARVNRDRMAFHFERVKAHFIRVHVKILKEYFYEIYGPGPLRTAAGYDDVDSDDDGDEVESGTADSMINRLEHLGDGSVFFERELVGKPNGATARGGKSLGTGFEVRSDGQTTDESYALCSSSL
jgi:hypothetical protein